MRSLALTALMSIAATSAPVAHAETPQPVGDEMMYTNAYVHCAGFRTGVAAQILACIAHERDIQDKRLDAALAKTLQALPPVRRARLTVAVGTWSAYRDAWCAITDDGAKRPEEQMASGECRLHETVRQTRKLEAMARDAAAM